MKSSLLKLVRRVDAGFMRATLPFTEVANGLVVLLFHSLHAESHELDHGLVDTRYAITVEKFRETLTHFLAAGYTPIGPAEVQDSGTGKRLMVTFDDGYFNNFLALPVLDALQVPATVFIATHYVQTGQGFWWDTLIRNRTTAGIPLAQIHTELGQLANQPHPAPTNYVVQRFGHAATRPVGDVDRPMTPRELRRFAAHPRITLGNHTHHHASLTQHPDAEITQQITLAQTALQDLVGSAPPWISYPNGKHDARVLRAVEAAGMRLGFTSRPRKTRGTPAHPLAIGRFVVAEADAVRPTCISIRADVSLLRTYSRWKNRGRPGPGLAPHPTPLTTPRGPDR